MEPAKEEVKRCPECGGVLEQGNALAFFSMLSGEAYLCSACKMLYYHDLKPWVRVIL
jgi:uncharacterized protein with PIN domain